MIPLESFSNGPNHLNRGLFSDYYLDEIVPHRPEWLQLPKDEIEQVWHALRALLDQLNLENLDEAQLENQWVQPVLQYLGHHFSVQVKIRYQQTGYRKPDYVFTTTPDEARALTSQIYTPAEIHHAIAVGDAKRYGAKLDQAAAPGQRNPSQQIDEYLRYSELRWGILTDGRYWRLYERDSSKNNVYYAVDLVDLLRRSDPQPFTYFYAFFCQTAFKGWLDSVLEGSISYAERVSEKLEERVYEALEWIAQGFLEYRRNRLSPDHLQTIYEQSLVLLYRLLFVFYAESRDILPLNENQRYARRQSMDALKRRIVKEHHPELSADRSDYHTYLNDLFFVIDQGDLRRYKIPPYNGRLFSDTEHSFLAEKVVGDAYLGPAITLLARVEGDGRDDSAYKFVDYRDLDVRRLGAIYEKLLEYQLDVAEVPLAEKDGKYVPATGSLKPIKQPGDVYLRTGSNERKVSGSYYTPDYIVRFMVERTLEPLLTDRTSQYATLDAEGHWQIDPAHADPLRQAILDLNVLDPAIGSGHFLVEATAYIAEWLRGLNLAPADLAAGEDELLYWKRQVVNACIYGVDINPLAVELAKLSLWLATLGRGKPLSFLDHHLKVGNSLVGATAREIGLDLTDDSAELSALLDDPGFAQTIGAAVEDMAAIEQTIATNVETVKQQEKQYAHLREQIGAWKQLAHVWVARHFGLTLDPATWTALRQHLLERQPTTPAIDTALTHTADLLASHRFFHWELEFPEVFFDTTGQPRPDAGFDAVIGNPPYVRQEHLQPLKPYLALKYAIYQGTADLFLYFYERGLRLLKNDQRLSYITAGTYMNTNSAKEFRKYIHEEASFEAVVDFGAHKLFKGVDLATTSIITVLRRGKHSNTFRSLFIEEDTLPESLIEALEKHGVDCSSDVTAMDEWRFQDIALTTLFKKLIHSSLTLNDLVAGNIYYGIKTGLNEAFFIDEQTRKTLIDEHPSSIEVIKPLRRGQDLRPWYQINDEVYLIFTRHGTDISKYPAIERYLQKFRSSLEPKPNNWSEGNWTGRKAGPYSWYEIQDQVTYYNQFIQPKIVWPNISKYPRFSWDNDELHLNDTGNFLISGLPTLAILNSRVIWFVITQIATILSFRSGLWQYLTKIQFIERLPIPQLTAAQASDLAALAEEITHQARTRYDFHETMRGRIRADLGKGEKLNERLESWWGIQTLNDLRDELKKAYGRGGDIPVGERDDWDKYLTAQRTRHEAMTADIIQLETRLNAIVYAAFHLTPDEIALIERSTKYPYGEV